MGTSLSLSLSLCFPVQFRRDDLVFGDQEAELLFRTRNRNGCSETIRPEAGGLFFFCLRVFSEAFSQFTADAVYCGRLLPLSTIGPSPLDVQNSMEIIGKKWIGNKPGCQFEIVFH